MFIAFWPVPLVAPLDTRSDMFIDKRSWRSYRGAPGCEGSPSYKHCAPLEQRRLSQVVITIKTVRCKTGN